MTPETASWYFGPPGGSVRSSRALAPQDLAGAARAARSAVYLRCPYLLTDYFC